MSEMTETAADRALRGVPADARADSPRGAVVFWTNANGQLEAESSARDASPVDIARCLIGASASYAIDAGISPEGAIRRMVELLAEAVKQAVIDRGIKELTGDAH